MSIKVIFRQKGKKDLFFNTELELPFCELVKKFYKADCTSKKTKEQMKFIFKGNEIADSSNEKLKDLKIGNLSEIKIDLKEMSAIQFAKDDWKSGIINNPNQLALSKNKINIEQNKNIVIKEELKVNSIDEMKLIYKIDKSKLNLKIFGKDFVNENKDKCKIRHYNGTDELKEYFDIDDNLKNKEVLEIILTGMTKITNMRHMFQECQNLLSISDISNLDFSKVTDVSGMFMICESLTSLPDLSKWNTENLTDAASIFLDCQSLSSLPDISKWNMSKVTNFSSMFAMCTSLISLPDISQWDTRNAKSMNAVFFGCVRLRSIPDISKWNTSNVNNIGFLFGLCQSIECIPDISNWDSTNFENIERLFMKCSNLKKLPNILKWVKNWKEGKTMKIAEMFEGVGNNLDEESKLIMNTFQKIFKTG